MITVNVNDRISAREAMEHPWIKNAEDLARQETTQMNDDEQMDINREIVKNLQNYRGESLLKKAAMNVLVKHLGPTQINKLKAEFEKIDKDFSGFLELSELEQAIQNAEFNMTNEEIASIVKELDFADNKKINYSEFIAATINAAEFLTEDKLEAIFKSFDIDNSGEITAQNLKDAFSKFGKEVTDEDIQAIMAAHDIDGGKTISLSEFTKMMLPEASKAGAKNYQI